MKDSVTSSKNNNEKSLRQLLMEQDQRDPIFIINTYQFFIDDFSTLSVEHILHEVLLIKSKNLLDHNISNNVLEYVLKQVDGLTN